MFFPLQDTHVPLVSASIRHLFLRDFIITFNNESYRKSCLLPGALVKTCLPTIKLMACDHHLFLNLCYLFCRWMRSGLSSAPPHRYMKMKMRSPCLPASAMNDSITAHKWCLKQLMLKNHFSYCCTTTVNIVLFTLLALASFLTLLVLLFLSLPNNIQLHDVTVM